MALHGMIAGTAEILDGTGLVLTSHKMHRQFGRNVACPAAITDLFPSANLPMQPAALGGGDPLVNHFIIQGMDKIIDSCQCPIWPGLDLGKSDELTLANPGCTHRFDLRIRLVEPCANRCHRKRRTCDTCGFENGLCLR